MNENSQDSAATETEVDEQLERDVADLLDLNEHIEKLTQEVATIKARLARRDPGSYPTQSGVTVQVKAPARRFDDAAAWKLLTPEQQALCVKPDPTKIKSQLPGVVVESLMVAGTGNPTVTVK